MIVPSGVFSPQTHSPAVYNSDKTQPCRNRARVPSLPTEANGTECCVTVLVAYTISESDQISLENHKDMLVTSDSVGAPQPLPTIPLLYIKSNWKQLYKLQ